MSIDATELARMKAIAEAATPGPWEAYPWADARRGICVEAGMWAVADSARPADAVHIATFDPPTVLALIEEVEELKAIIEDQDALHDSGWGAMKAQRDKARAQVASFNPTLLAGGEGK